MTMDGTRHKTNPQQTAAVPLCAAYCSRRGCSDQTCCRLHLCKYFADENSCKFGDKCKYSHSLNTLHNRQVLKSHGTSAKAATVHLVINETHSKLPWICKYYNKGCCKYGTEGTGCTALHLCVHYVKGDCISGKKCKLNHDIRKPQSANLLQQSGVHLRGGIDDIVRELRAALPDTEVTSENQPTSEEPDICMYFLGPKGCLFKDKCHNIHRPKSYQWQVLDSKSDQWRDFSERLNEEIELNYATPMSDKCYCGAEQEGRTLYHFNFEQMEVTFDDELSYKKVRRLSTKSSVCVSPFWHQYATKWKWYWKNDRGTWLAFEKIISDAIEEHYWSKERQHTGHCFYNFDFRKMIQTKDGIQIPIRRRPESSQVEIEQPSINPTTLNIPKYWDENYPTDNPSFMIIKLERNGKTEVELKKVEKLFQKTMPLEKWSIVSIERIQNLELWEGYIWKQRWIEKKFDLEKGGEQLLFHGTSKANIDIICQQGFDWRLAGKSVGTLYGKGSYFARDAKYSASYAEGKMFLVRVLVGRYTLGKRDITIPPDNNHTCVDDMHNPSIYVTFEHQQTYPEYIITYEETD